MLLNHFFELGTEHVPAVAIKRDVEPITFFALHSDTVGLRDVPDRSGRTAPVDDAIRESR